MVHLGKRLSVPWTPEQDAVLLDMWRARTPTLQVAEHFGRTTTACESRVRRLVYIDMTPEERHAAIAARGRQGYRWSREELDTLRANIALPCREIAKLIPGRSPEAIGHYIEKITGCSSSYARSVARGAEERPLDVPFTTSSGVRAIRCSKYGLVPYVPSLYR
jgi:hypothetical protein